MAPDGSTVLTFPCMSNNIQGYIEILNTKSIAQIDLKRNKEFENKEDISIIVINLRYLQLKLLKKQGK